MNAYPNKLQTSTRTTDFFVYINYSMVKGVYIMCTLCKYIYKSVIACITIEKLAVCAKYNHSLYSIAVTRKLW